MNRQYEIKININGIQPEIEVFHYDKNKKWVKCCPQCEWNHRNFFPRQLHVELEDELDLTRRKLLELRKFRRRLLDDERSKEFFDLVKLDAPDDRHGGTIINYHNIINLKALTLVERMFEGFNGGNYMEWKLKDGDIDKLRKRLDSCYLNESFAM
jgi:hypothetical protein